MTNAETTDKTTTVAEQGAHVAPEKVASKKSASQKKDAPKAKKSAKAAAPTKELKTGKKAKPQGKATTPRAESKGARILEMIGGAKGASLAEIMKAANWQAHSVRGFLSTAGKKHGLKIESAKNDAGERFYKMIVK